MPEKKDRPLPEPSRRTFGRSRQSGEREGQGLMADEIAKAAAEGRLDEFLGSEVPDNEYAKALVSMMLGMTGMAPVTVPPGSAMKDASADEPVEPCGPPEDVVEAVRAGDAQRLMGLLQREQMKRSRGEEPGETAKPDADAHGTPVIEKDIIDQILKIASDNNLTPDWLFLRAIKLYVQEYQRTGRL